MLQYEVMINQHAVYSGAPSMQPLKCEHPHALVLALYKQHIFQMKQLLFYMIVHCTCTT